MANNEQTSKLPQSPLKGGFEDLIQQQKAKSPHNYQCLEKDCGFFESPHYNPCILCPNCGGLNWKYWGTVEEKSVSLADILEETKPSLKKKGTLLDAMMLAKAQVPNFNWPTSIKQLAKANLKVGYADWLEADGSTKEVPPSAVDFVGDHLNMLSNGDMKKILSDDTIFVFEMLKAGLFPGAVESTKPYEIPHSMSSSKDAIESLFNDKLWAGYATWLKAGKGTAAEVLPSMVANYVDQMDKLTVQAVDAVLSGQTDFVFDALKASPKAFTDMSAGPPAVEETPLVVSEVLTIGNLDEAISQLEIYFKCQDKASEALTSALDNSLESDLVSLMGLQAPHEEGEPLTLTTVDQAVAALKAKIEHQKTFNKPGSYVKEKGSNKVEPTVMCLSCQIQPDTWFGHEPCDDPNCFCEAQCGQCLTASVKKNEYYGIDPAEGLTAGFYKGIPIYHAPDNVDESAGCPAPAPTFDPELAEFLDPKLVEIAMQYTPEELTFQEVHGDLMGKWLAAGVDIGVDFGNVNTSKYSVGYVATGRINDLPVEGVEPAIKSHTHLQNGKRQRCTNDNCPVGS